MTAVPISDLLRVFGRIGLLSFGGPAAQIAMMHRELVEECRAAWNVSRVLGHADEIDEESLFTKVGAGGDW